MAPVRAAYLKRHWSGVVRPMRPPPQGGRLEVGLYRAQRKRLPAILTSDAGSDEPRGHPPGKHGVIEQCEYAAAQVVVMVRKDGTPNDFRMTLDARIGSKPA